MNLSSASRLCLLQQSPWGRRGSLPEVASGIGVARRLPVACANKDTQVNMEDTTLHAHHTGTTDSMNKIDAKQVPNLDAGFKMEDSTLGALVEGSAKGVRDSSKKQSPKLLTLVVVEKEGSVLLGMKKRGFGAGYYNGFGGKVEPGETIDEAAIRELQEESGIVAAAMEKRGILAFHFDDNPQPWEAHVYHVGDYVGEPHETEEMAPRWFSVADLPYEEMWQDNPLWYPEFLRGRFFKGAFHFHNTHTLVSHSFQILPQLEG